MVNDMPQSLTAGCTHALLWRARRWLLRNLNDGLDQVLTEIKKLGLVDQSPRRRALSSFDRLSIERPNLTGTGALGRLVSLHVARDLLVVLACEDRDTCRGVSVGDA